MLYTNVERAFRTTGNLGTPYETLTVEEFKSNAVGIQIR